MNPTAEQKIAIETQDRALVVEAGAGTGKTWALVQRFLHLLDVHPDWSLDSILAITFTKKASREMRSRLRRAIEARANQYPEDLHWREHRLNLDRMQVSTIHGLCTRILRENAIGAGIDPKFQVLDEQESELLKEEAIRAAIQSLDESNHPALALLASLRVYDLRNEMGAMLRKRGTLIQLFRGMGESDDILERWRDGLLEMRIVLWQTRLQENPDLITVIKTLPTILIRESDDLLAVSVMNAQKGCGEYSQGNLVEALKQWQVISLRGGKKDNWGGKDALNDLKADLRLLKGSAGALEKSGGLREIDHSDVSAAQHLQLWRDLWLHLDKTYSQIKTDGQVMDFDDLELLTDELLQKKPNSHRLGGFMEHINHLMVDEFQDTNLVQQRIVYALAPPDQPGKLFVVGDAKQSIYRFRQAQVSIFNRTSLEVESVTGYPPAKLSTSFRTHQSLVWAANSLFDTIFAPLGDEHAPYEAMPGPLTAYRDVNLDTLSPVEILLIPSKDTDDKNINLETARIWEAGWIAQRLIDLKASQFKVWDKELSTYRPFAYKDAVVLFRATTQVPLYEAEFKKFGLPYLTISGRGYYDRPEVQDLIALLAALANPADDLNLAAALRSPLFSLSDETLYRLRWHTQVGDIAPDPILYKYSISHPPETDQPELVKRAGAIIQKLLKRVDRVDVWTLVRAALDFTSYEVTLTKLDGKSGRQLANVQKFLALARDRGESTLSDFLRRLRDLKAREAREGEALGREPESGAAQLMSIHASKGLEFPVVILADMGRRKSSGGGSPYLLHDPAFGLVCKVRDESGDWVTPAGYAWGKWMNQRMEDAESKRLLYVACTRAADLLILTGKTGGRMTWLSEVQDAWSIPGEGPVEEIVDVDGFSVRIFRPEEPPVSATSEKETYNNQPPVVTEVPRLALPLQKSNEWAPLAVTRLEQVIGKGEAKTPDFHPVIWKGDRYKKENRAPAYLVGRIVHSALSHWDCLEFSDREIFRLLEEFARNEGVFSDALGDAVHRSHRILWRFRRDDVYRKVNLSLRKYHEIPFTLKTPTRMLYGAIDLLYQNPDGRWKLLDWKTEWTEKKDMDEKANGHLTQLAVYTEAIHQNLRVRPDVGVCFMEPEIEYYPFPFQRLEDTWLEVVAKE